MIQKERSHADFADSVAIESGCTFAPSPIAVDCGRARTPCFSSRFWLGPRCVVATCGERRGSSGFDGAARFAGDSRGVGQRWLAACRCKDADPRGIGRRWAAACYRCDGNPRGRVDARRDACRDACRDAADGYDAHGRDVGRNACYWVGATYGGFEAALTACGAGGPGEFFAP